MAEEFASLKDDTLDEVSGGGKHRYDDCPAGCIESKENLPHESSKRGHCHYCGGKPRDVKIWFSETKKVHKGQQCEKCQKMWIYGDSIKV